jgi:ferredoxin
MVRITVDTDRCIGAGQCVLSAPDVFDQDDQGLVVVADEDAAESDPESVEQATRICPSQAISVHP